MTRLSGASHGAVNLCHGRRPMVHSMRCPALPRAPSVISRRKECEA
jgi:hypothetical protein